MPIARAQLHRNTVLRDGFDRCIEILHAEGCMIVGKSTKRETIRQTTAHRKRPFLGKAERERVHLYMEHRPWA